MKITHKNQSIEIGPKGASIISWKWNDKDVFFPRQNLAEKGEDVIRGVTHDCFPNFGKVDEVTGVYKLPPHGFMRDTLMEGEVTEREPTSYEKKALGIEDELILCYHAEYEHFADDEFNFYFIFKKEIILFSRGFHEHIWIQGPEKSKKKILMPIAPAFHPYLNCPTGKASVEIDGHLRAISKEEKEIDNERTMFKNLSLTWREDSKRIRVKIPENGTLVMRLDSGFTNLQRAGMNLWRNSDSYLCVEPVTCFPENFGKLLLSSKTEEAGIGCTYLFMPEVV